MSAPGLFAKDLSPPVNSNNIETAQKNVTWFPLCLSVVSLVLNDLPNDDANIIFFVSGYIDRSILRRKKCFARNSLLMEGRFRDYYNNGMENSAGDVVTSGQ